MTCKDYNNKTPGRKQHLFFLSDNDNKLLVQVFNYIKQYVLKTNSLVLTDEYMLTFLYKGEKIRGIIKQLGKGAYGSVMQVSFDSKKIPTLVIKLQNYNDEFKREVDVFNKFTEYNYKYNIPHMQSILYYNNINNMVGVMITQKAVNSIDNILQKKSIITKNFTNFISCIIQVLITIYIYSNTKNIHCDMHLGNFLVYDTYTKCGYWKYNITDKISVNIPNYGFYIVSHDFGLNNTCESKSMLYDYYRAFSNHGGFKRLLTNKVFTKREDFLKSYNLIDELYKTIIEIGFDNLKEKYKNENKKEIFLPNSLDWENPLFKYDMIDKRVSKKMVLGKLLNVCYKHSPTNLTFDKKDLIDTYTLHY